MHFAFPFLTLSLVLSSTLSHSYTEHQSIPSSIGFHSSWWSDGFPHFDSPALLCLPLLFLLLFLLLLLLSSPLPIQLGLPFKSADPTPITTPIPFPFTSFSILSNCHQYLIKALQAQLPQHLNPQTYYEFKDLHLSPCLCSPPLFLKLLYPRRARLPEIISALTAL